MHQHAQIVDAAERVPELVSERAEKTEEPRRCMAPIGQQETRLRAEYGGGLPRDSPRVTLSRAVTDDNAARIAVDLDSRCGCMVAQDEISEALLRESGEDLPMGSEELAGRRSRAAGVSAAGSTT
jgi:hypothetical protein